MTDAESNGSLLKDNEDSPNPAVAAGVVLEPDYAVPASSEDADRIGPDSYRKHKRLALAGALLTVVCSGAAFGLFGSTESDFFAYTDTEQLINLVGMGLFSLFIFFWCYCDALERQYPLSKTMKICLVAILAIAFPVYAFRSRGLAGFKTLGWAILFLLLSCVAVGTGAWISYGIKHVLKIGS